MMDFITIPLVVGIVTLGIYKLFELFVRKKERLTLIEKLGEKLNPDMLHGTFPVPVKLLSNFSTGALKTGCLLAGIGLGLLIGILIAGYGLHIDGSDLHNYETRELMGVIFGASVLLFGGIGLLVAFLVEMRINRKERG